MGRRLLYRTDDTEETKRQKGAPPAVLYACEDGKERCVAYLGKVMKEVYDKDARVYIIGKNDYTMGIIEGAAVMWRMCVERGWINEYRTVSAFHRLLQEVLPGEAVPPRNHFNQKIDEVRAYWKEMKTGELAGECSEARQREVAFLHRAYGRFNVQ